ncbi:globin isoform X2 [Palaemon carinicauda]|uniref:globin isoform X2 n=1 Tax=Palaemon carinicauda TaxID=392227 RepID=UPI0035B677C9
MGSMLSMVYVWWSGSSKVGTKSLSEYGDLGPDADQPDATTGLTLRHRTAMVRTWDLVRPDVKTHGVNFFITLFREEPILKTRFKGFQNKTEDELRANRRLAAHGSTVLHAISMLVDNLDDVGTLVDLLKTTGENHSKRGIPKEDFELLAPVLVAFLRNSLGSAWSPLAEEAWTKALTVINAVIHSAYDNPSDS